MIFFILDNRLPKPQDKLITLTSLLAISSGSIGVDFQNIPNEPIRYVVKTD